MGVLYVDGFIDPTFYRYQWFVQTTLLEIFLLFSDRSLTCDKKLQSSPTLSLVLSRNKAFFKNDILHKRQ